MYIQSSKRQDIKKSYSEWRSKYDARKAEYDKQYEDYRVVNLEYRDKIKSKLYEIFKEYIDQLPGLEIEVNILYHAVIKFKYKPAENERYLSWVYEFNLDNDGTVESYYNTWRDLSLTNLDEVDNLITSAKLIRALVAFNWSDFMLSIRDDIPKEEDYVHIPDPDTDPEYQNPGLNIDLLALDIQRAAGQDIWFECADGWLNILQINSIAKTDNYEIIDGPYEIVAYIVEVNAHDIKCNKESAKSKILNRKDIFRKFWGPLSYLNIVFPVNMVTSQELLDIVNEGA